MKNLSFRRAAIFGGLPLLVAVISYWLWRAFTHSPALIDQCDAADFSRNSAPIVVVGVVAADVLVRSPVPMHSNPIHPLQFRKLTLNVENVLKGAPVPKPAVVYYFTWAGGFDGPQPLGFWTVGSRRIFWLRRDSQVLRTACDGWDGCTMSVQSGSHLNYQRDTQKPIEYALADLLLTRGGGTVNEIGFATEIGRGVPDQELQGYVVEKLRNLALTEHGDVRSSACEMLWLYSKDRIVGVRQSAGDALLLGRCRVFKKARRQCRLSVTAHSDERDPARTVAHLLLTAESGSSKCNSSASFKFASASSSVSP
jgi:hypothetical protein